MGEPRSFEHILDALIRDAQLRAPDEQAWRGDELSARWQGVGALTNLDLTLRAVTLDDLPDADLAGAQPLRQVVLNLSEDEDGFAGGEIVMSYDAPEGALHRRVVMALEALCHHPPASAEQVPRFVDYTDAALRRAEIVKGRDAVLYAVLGLAGKAGEVAEMVKQTVFKGHAPEREALLDELGDVLWYLNLLAVAHDASLAEVGAHNLRKLQERYPTGAEPLRTRDRDI